MLVALVVVLVAAYFAYGALAGEGASASAGKAGDEANAEEGFPQLSDYNPTVYTASGDPVQFTEIADGRPLIVNFWATWCPYCVQEMPDFQMLYDEYGDRVAFAFVDCADGKRETVAGARAWLEEQGLTLPAYFDVELDAMYVYGATNLPTTAIVDASGNILDVSAGRIDVSRMRNTLDSLTET